MKHYPITLPLCLISLMIAACAAAPPEVVANKQAPKFTGKIEVIPAALLAQMKASTWHAGCPVGPEDLRQLTLSYWNFDRTPITGVLVVHQEVAEEVVAVFRDLFQHGFLIERMAPVENYQGNDDTSMAANNTSAFNCRDVTGQPGKFSNHSWGRAIDINPLTNPYIKGEKVLPPEGSKYVDRSKAFPGSILADSFAVKRFAERGWQWGGSWSDRKDYQHFEKPVAH